jgi:nitroreductase
MSFHLALLDVRGAHRLDDPPDLTCKEITRQHAVDDPLLSCKQQVPGSSPRQLCDLRSLARVRHPGALLPSVMARGVGWPVGSWFQSRHQWWRLAFRTSLREVDVETWDAIRSRRNVRSYGQRAIAPEDLDRILEAARRTPSAGNQQAWDFVVCTDPEQLTQLATVGPAAGHIAGSAAAIALVAPRSDNARMHDLIQLDLGQATMSVMLAAADLGIGSAHAGVQDQELARRLLGVPEDRFCALLITLGVPADRPLTLIQRPDRRPFDDVVHRGHW